jgi:ribosomal protein S12 methylthiotransferase
MGQLKLKTEKMSNMKLQNDEGNVIVINTCGFIDNAKAESVNTILEYADKKRED